MKFADRIRRHVQRICDGEVDDDAACDLGFETLSQDAIGVVETQLGFELPPPLRQLYAEVGNGGYGPAFGLLGLVGGAREVRLDAVETYQAYREPDPNDAFWSWPEGLLPAVSLGCAMFLCVDLKTSDGEVVLFEPNPHVSGEPWGDAFFRLGRSFESLMLGWIDGEDFAQLLGQGQSEGGE